MPTVLVIDDSKFSRSRVVAAIEPLGWNIVEAGDGEDGLSRLGTQTFDLVVSDLLMPRTDGFGVLRGVRERGLTVPVVICSADIQASSRDEAERLGAAAFLNKPFRPEELRETATSLAGRVAVGV